MKTLMIIGMRLATDVIFVLYFILYTSFLHIAAITILYRHIANLKVIFITYRLIHSLIYNITLIAINPINFYGCNFNEVTLMVIVLRNMLMQILYY